MDDLGASTTATVASVLLAVAREHGAREALVDGDVRITHAEMLSRAAVVAGRLGDLGVRPGDRVAILLPNGWQYAVGYFGAQLAGAVAVLVNTRLSTPEIGYVLDDSGALVVLTDETLGSRIPAECTARVLPAAELTAAPRPDEPPVGPGALPWRHRSPEGVAHLIYTSGTAGRPRAAMQTHANLVFTAGTVRKLLGAEPGERTLVAAPMFHATATVTQLIGFVAAGACCVFTPAFQPSTAVRLLAEERITVFAGVAPWLRLILRELDHGGADLSALRLFVMGGSPMPESFPAEVAGRLPELTLGNVWGLTEATSIVTYTEAAEYAAQPWSVGRPVRGVEVAISVDGRPPLDLRDTVGELCVRGPVVTAGYWGRPTDTASTFVGGWLHTGETGSVDSAGFVRVLDRAKDMSAPA